MLLQFAALSTDAFPAVAPQHDAFLVDVEQLDRAPGWIRSTARDHRADPQRTRPGQTNTEHGGRGVYLLDPVGHHLEPTTAHHD